MYFRVITQSRQDLNRHNTLSFHISLSLSVKPQCEMITSYVEYFFLLENETWHNLWLISDVSLPTFYTCLEMVTLSNFKDKKYSHVKLFLVGLSRTESNQKKTLFKNAKALN